MAGSSPFDRRVLLGVYDEQVIAEYDPETVVEYPKWSRDEELIIRDSNKLQKGGDPYQPYAYRMS